MTPYPKSPPLRDRKWLDYIATLPCRVCGSMETVVPAHIGHSSMGMKDSDDAVMPLCYRHHAELDGGNKEKWLVKNIIRPELTSAYQAWKGRA